MVQILISNYAIPANYKPKEMLKPGDPAPPPPSEPQQFNNIVYHDNAGYQLTVSNLPWGKSSFKLKRYRISRTQNLGLVEEKTTPAIR